MQFKANGNWLRFEFQLPFFCLCFPFESVKFFNCISLAWYPTIFPLSPLGICCLLERAACRIAPINGDLQWSAEFVFHQQIFTQSTFYFPILLFAFFAACNMLSVFEGFVVIFSNFQGINCQLLFVRTAKKKWKLNSNFYGKFFCKLKAI